MTAPESDQVSHAKRGDPDAFEGLVRAHEGRVRSFFALHLKDPAEAEDLAQETFLHAYRKLGTFDTSLPFYPWLKGIANNVLRNRRRKHRPDPLREEWAWEIQEAHVSPFEDQDILQIIRSCLEKLESPAADLVRARYLGGESLGEIAARTGRSPHSLSMALVRIRELLRECLTRSQGGAP